MLACPVSFYGVELYWHAAMDLGVHDYVLKSSAATKAAAFHRCLARSCRLLRRLKKPDHFITGVSHFALHREALCCHLLRRLKN
jgi:hypothetical protein